MLTPPTIPELDTPLPAIDCTLVNDRFCSCIIKCYVMITYNLMLCTQMRNNVASHLCAGTGNSPPNSHTDPTI